MFIPIAILVLSGLSFLVGLWLLFLLYENDGFLAALLTFFFGFPALFYVIRNWSIYKTAFLTQVAIIAALIGLGFVSGLTDAGSGVAFDSSTIATDQQPVVEKPRYAADRVGYHNYCADCHGESADVSAPAIRDHDEWQARMDARGLDQLMLNAYQGYRGHPRLGGCTMCTSEQVDNMTYHLLTESGVDVPQR